MQVSIDRRGITVDGSRRLIRAGELPYHRLPSPELWPGRVRRMREAGLDAVSVSYPWSYHCPRRGELDFEGARDVDRLHDLIADAGLWLIARPGPYLGQDLDLGGLPAWLLRVPGVVPRCRDERGYRWSPAYLECAGEWLERIVPRFARRPNLLWVQVESGWVETEPLARLPLDLADLAVRWLGSERIARAAAAARRGAARAGIRRWPRRTRDPRASCTQHVAELARRVRALGVEVPVVHADRWSDRERQLAVDLPALRFAPLGAGAGPRERRAALEAPLHHAADLERAGLDVPLVYADLQAGRAARRGTDPDALRERLGPALGDGLAKMALAGGAAAWSWSPFCGGTTPGYLGAPETTTSYDAAAPLAESGAATPAWEAARELDAFLEPYLEDLPGAGPLADAGAWCPEHVGTRRGSAAGRSYAFLCNPRPRPARVPTPESERCELAPWEVQIRVYGPDGSLESVSPPPPQKGADPAVPPPLPRLNTWQLCGASPQLDPAYDDAAWREIEPRDVELGRTDIDTLGVHHGFVWYRGTFAGDLDRLILDARHCWSAWINGRLVAGGDALRNRHGLGPDGARPRRVRLRDMELDPRRNALVILVESLGHGQHLAGNERSGRGLLRIDTGETRVRWRFRGGLLAGERGIAPHVDMDAVERTPGGQVVLPHGWRGEPGGVLLYETRFGLEGIDPSALALGLSIDAGSDRANLYLNGQLIGRHGPGPAPQRRFALPWGILRSDAENHLGVALWKRGARAALGKLRLEPL